MYRASRAPLGVAPAAAFVVELLVAACGDEGTGPGPGPEPEPTTPQPASVRIVPDEATLHAIGDTVVLEAGVFDATGQPIEDAAIEWRSLDPTIVTVDSLGRVVAGGEGEARVRAAAGERYAEATVVVRQVPAAITLDRDTATLAEGSAITLVAMAVDSNGVAIEDPPYAWTSSDTTAKVTGDGQVIAVRGEGVARITVASGPAAASAEIHVLGKIAFYGVDLTAGTSRYIGVMNSDGRTVVRLTGAPQRRHSPPRCPPTAPPAGTSARPPPPRPRGRSGRGAGCRTRSAPPGRGSEARPGRCSARRR